MKNSDLLIAANTLWVVVAAVLVMFMQAGFAFLEAGLTRMKNAAHIAGKNVLIFAVCSLVYWAVGFGIAFGDGGSLIGTHGFVPSVDSMLAIGKAPYSFFTTIPAAGGYMFEVVFAGVSLAIVWGAMAERAKLWVYFVFSVFLHARLLVRLTLESESRTAGSSDSGMQPHQVDRRALPGRVAALTAARSSRGTHGAGRGRRARVTPATTCPTPSSGRSVLWFGWFRFNPVSTLLSLRSAARLRRLGRADDEPRGRRARSAWARARLRARGRTSR